MNISNKCLASLLLGLLASNAAAGEVKIPEGTAAKLHLVDSLSSATAVQGQRFDLILDTDISADGRVVVPHGAKAVGSVVSTHKRGHMGKAGELNIQVEYLLVNDQRIPLRASSGQEGDNKVGSTVALTVLFGPIGLLKRGKDVVINSGTVVDAVVDQSTNITTAN